MTNSKTSNIYGHCNTCGAESMRLCKKGCVSKIERTVEMVFDQVKIGYSVANATAYVKRMDRYLANPGAL